MRTSFLGKTTLAGALANHCGFVHLHLDALARTKGLVPEEGISDEQWGYVFREVYQPVATLLASGKSVVFDAVNYDRAGRDHLRTIAKQNDSSVHVIYINLPIQEIEQRRQVNQTSHQRPFVRDTDFAELAIEFEIPTIEENLSIYNGTQLIRMDQTSYSLWSSHRLAQGTPQVIEPQTKLLVDRR